MITDKLPAGAVAQLIFCVNEEPFMTKLYAQQLFEMVSVGLVHVNCTCDGPSTDACRVSPAGGVVSASVRPLAVLLSPDLLPAASTAEMLNV